MFLSTEQVEPAVVLTLSANSREETLLLLLLIPVYIVWHIQTMGKRREEEEVWVHLHYSTTGTKGRHWIYIFIAVFCCHIHSWDTVVSYSGRRLYATRYIVLNRANVRMPAWSHCLTQPQVWLLVSCSSIMACGWVRHKYFSSPQARERAEKIPTVPEVISSL